MKFKSNNPLVDFENMLDQSKKMAIRISAVEKIIPSRRQRNQWISNVCNRTGTEMKIVDGMYYTFSNA